MITQRAELRPAPPVSLARPTKLGALPASRMASRAFSFIRSSSTGPVAPSGGGFFDAHRLRSLPIRTRLRVASQPPASTRGPLRASRLRWPCAAHARKCCLYRGDTDSASVRCAGGSRAVQIQGPRHSEEELRSAGRRCTPTRRCRADSRLPCLAADRFRLRRAGPIPACLALQPIDSRLRRARPIRTIGLA